MSNEPAPGDEAVAGQFFEPLMKAHRAQIAAASWDTQGGPRALADIYKQRTAESTKTVARREVPDGSSPAAPGEVSMEALRHAARQRGERKLW